MAEACWKLLMEFVQGIFGHSATSEVPRTLQVSYVLCVGQNIFCFMFCWKFYEQNEKHAKTFCLYRRE